MRLRALRKALHDGALAGPHRHLTLEERRTIFRLLDAKVPVGEIAHRLARRRSTIFREIGRNPFRDVKECRGYFPVTADDSARRRRQRRRKLIRNARLRQHGTEMLARRWSPEQIAGRLKHLGDDARVCHETIHRFVYGPEGGALELHRHLLRARRLRRRRFGRKPRGPKIPPPRTIGRRPADIGHRQELGHREADLLVFRRPHDKADVTPLVERHSRLTRLIPNRDRRSRGVGAIGEALVSLPPAARRTITFDRGSEFLGYDDLARDHGIDAYFRGPHSPPWQKGGVENTNGRLRRHPPGELDLSAITPTYLREIEGRMNATPRKCLGFRAPQEAFAAMAG